MLDERTSVEKLTNSLAFFEEVVGLVFDPASRHIESWVWNFDYVFHFSRLVFSHFLFFSFFLSSSSSSSSSFFFLNWDHSCLRPD